MIIGSYDLSVRYYSRIKRKYIKSLPGSPLSIPKFKLLFTLMTKYVSIAFEPIIREELSYYLKHHYELEDLQEGRGMGTWLEFIKKTENLDGDILELGIYRGGLTVMTARFLQKLHSKRRIYACEGFVGLPYEDRFSIWENAKGFYADTSPDLVLKKFQKFGVSDKITLVEGLFEKTLYEKLTDKKFSLVLVDCDLYDATKFAMKFVYPRLVKGGTVVFDEYDVVDVDQPACGETTAVNEFCSSENLTVNLFPVPHIIK